MSFCYQTCITILYTFIKVSYFIQGIVNDRELKAVFRPTINLGNAIKRTTKPKISKLVFFEKK